MARKSARQSSTYRATFLTFTWFYMNNNRCAANSIAFNRLFDSKCTNKVKNYPPHLLKMVNTVFFFPNSGQKNNYSPTMRLMNNYLIFNQ